MHDGSGREGSRRSPARHDLLAVAPGGWASVAGTRAPRPPLSAAAAAVVERWGAAGRPVVVRRPAPGDPPGAVPVGLPLPPDLGKARVALAVPEGVPWHPLPPVPLARARPAAPEPWRPAIDAALSLGAALSLVPAVFGALLWESLTGLAYLHPASDLDLLWPIPHADALPPLLDGLARLDAAAPMRVDGEVLTPRGGVNWRELAAARRGETGIVLAKGMARAAFVAADELFAPEERACTEA